MGEVDPKDRVRVAAPTVEAAPLTRRFGASAGASTSPTRGEVARGHAVDLPEVTGRPPRRRSPCSFRESDARSADDAESAASANLEHDPKKWHRFLEKIMLKPTT
jgi:hypothetical protein